MLSGPPQSHGLLATLKHVETSEMVSILFVTISLAQFHAILNCLNKGFGEQIISYIQVYSGDAKDFAAEGIYVVEM